MKDSNQYIHIKMKHAKTGLKIDPAQISLKYLAAWRKMANNTYIFPIAVGLWPLTFMTDTTRIIVKSVKSK